MSAGRTAAPQSASSAALVPPPVQRFRELAANRFGLQLGHLRDEALSDLLRRRLAATGLGAEAYFQRMRCDSTEAAVLTPELTVAETYFFRQPEHFTALCEWAMATRPMTPGSASGVRILCAGCASGEEAYSIAITLCERLNMPATIRAVDLNPGLIEHARRGIYGAWSLRGASPQQKQRWFRASGRSHWQVDASIRAAVSFEQGNLSDDDALLWAHEGYDAVFCRNLLMYFTPDQAQRLVARIERALSPGGCLFLGHAETLRTLSTGFALRERAGCFFYQRVDAATARPEIPPQTVTSRADEPADDWWVAIAGATARVAALARRTGAEHTAAQPQGGLQQVRQLLHAEQHGAALEKLDALPAATRGAARDALPLQALALTQAGRLAEAEHCCHALLARDACDAAAHYLLALCREAAGDIETAARCARDAARHDPGFALPRLQLARLARRSGDRQAHREEIRQARALLQNDDAARLQLFSGFPRETLLALAEREQLAAPAAWWPE